MQNNIETNVNSNQNTQQNQYIDSNENFSYEIETNAIGGNYYFVSDGANYNFLTLDDLKNYIKNPMVFNKILRKISREAYNSNGQYANTINRSVSAPTLSHIMITRNKNSKNKKYKTAIDLLMKKINHKKTTRDILRHELIDGMYVGILRDTKTTNKNVIPEQGFIDSLDQLEGLGLEKNLMIQPLDLDYCKIIGFLNNSNVAAFDMMYFDQFKHNGLLHEIKNFPSDFLQAYKNYRKDASKRWYILDPKKTIALKFGANLMEAYGRPFGLQAFKDIKFNEDYEDSQHKLVNELASSIYYMILPEGEINNQ